MPKSTQTRKDKSDSKYTKPMQFLHLCSFVKRCRMDKALYIAGVYNLIATEHAAVKLTIPLLKETLDNAQNGSWWSLTNLTQTF